MEDVLELYAEAPDPQRPVVCFDETPRQEMREHLIEEVNLALSQRRSGSSEATSEEETVAA